MYDLIIRNGMVIDGSGLPGYPADVGVKDGRIAAIGRLREPARRELDAEGHVVTPGFIDLHTHLDAQMFWDPLGASSCWQGVTTAVMGNCGFTLAPASAAQRGFVVRNLERAEDISGAAMEAGIPWGWSTFREYLDVIDRLPKGLNYAANIGHSALRTFAMGEAAFERAATDDELAAMERELVDGLNAGAIGFTTSRSMSHSTADDRPVASRMAAWEEMERLVMAMGACSRGVFEIAMPGGGAHGPDPEKRKEVLSQLADLSVRSGVLISWGILPYPKSCGVELQMLDEAAARGGRMIGQSHSRGVALLFSYQTRMPYDWLPDWKRVRDLPIAEQRRAFMDPEARAGLVASARAAVFPRGTSADSPFPPDFESLVVLSNPVPPNFTVAEVAAQRGCDPVEVLIDLAVETDFKQMYMQPVYPWAREDVLKVMRHPRCVMTFSDSGAHVTQIMDSSIQTHLLAHWVRREQVLSLEEGVRMLTLAPAVNWGFSDRGLLREGMVADINVFDPERISPSLPTLEADLPTGAKRLEQRSLGMLATIVGGEVVIEAGAHTGAAPGRLLRSGQHA